MTLTFFHSRFISFSQWFPSQQCSIILLWCEGNVSLFLKYLYLPNFSDYHVDIFTASHLIFYCSFSSLLVSSLVMISFYIPCKKLFLEHKGLSDGRVVWLTETCIVVQYTISKVVKIYKAFKMVNWDLLKFLFVGLSL